MSRETGIRVRNTDRSLARIVGGGADLFVARRKEPRGGVDDPDSTTGGWRELPRAGTPGRHPGEG